MRETFGLSEEQIKTYIYEDCEIFHDGQSPEDYRRDIIKYLVLCNWHYSLEDAEKIVSREEQSIDYAYKHRKTVGDIAIDIGYACG